MSSRRRSTRLRWPAGWTTSAPSPRISPKPCGFANSIEPLPSSSIAIDAPASRSGLPRRSVARAWLLPMSRREAPRRAPRRDAVGRFAGRGTAPHPRVVPSEAGGRTLCGQCGAILDERSDLADEDRQPCPSCGSITRRFELELEGSVGLHSSLGLKARHAGERRPFLERFTGASFSTRWRRWMDKLQRIDREGDPYDEVRTLRRARSSTRCTSH